MTTTVASAPGKVVVCGEYAVLDGAPAIGMAVNRRARARISTAERDCHTVRTKGVVEGEWTGQEIPAGDLDLLHEVWKSAGIEGRFDIDLDTSEFVDTASGSKLGLGSSAALTAALVTGISELAGKPQNVETKAIEAHQRFQQGRGSGVDVATSLNGGVIEYRMAGPCRSLPWPAGLQCAVLWSGRPSSTGDMLSRLDRPGRQAPGLCDASAATAETWSGGNVLDLLAALRLYVDALAKFDVDRSLGIFDAGHGELVAAAAGQNLVYKPCGAGGGDIGMVFASDARAVRDFADIAGDSGFQLLDVELQARGVLIEG
ncbi:MAG: mevalonate kinase [Woeseia sp.]